MNPPPPYRGVNLAHIHFFKYSPFGTKMKSSLESLSCKQQGQWKPIPPPCKGKTGQAAFFAGFNKVFSAALPKAKGKWSIVVWPSSCGNTGTIVEAVYEASIEYPLRGKADPACK